jgi:hypothetical protein
MAHIGCFGDSFDALYSQSGPFFSHSTATHPHKYLRGHNGPDSDYGPSPSQLPIIHLPKCHTFIDEPARLTLFLCTSSNFLSASVICLPPDLETFTSSSRLSSSSESAPRLLLSASLLSSLAVDFAFSRDVDDSAIDMDESLPDVVALDEDFFFFFLS